MSRLVYLSGISGDEFSDLVGHFCKTKMGATLNRVTYTYLLLLNATGVVGVVVFSDFTKTTCNIHVYTPKCLNRKTLRLMLAYPFNQLKLKKIFGTIQSNNTNASRNAEKIGFTLDNTIKDYYATGVDMLVYALTKEQASKWIANSNSDNKQLAA